jgi:hypothetical protein
MLVLLCAAAEMRAADRDHDRSALVGTCRLVRYVDTLEGSTPIQAFGAEPIGLVIFTADADVSISNMRNPLQIATATTDPDPDVCIPGWSCA